MHSTVAALGSAGGAPLSSLRLRLQLSETGSGRLARGPFPPFSNFEAPGHSCSRPCSAARATGTPAASVHPVCGMHSLGGLLATLPTAAPHSVSRQAAPALHALPRTSAPVATGGEALNSKGSGFNSDAVSNNVSETVSVSRASNFGAEQQPADAGSSPAAKEGRSARTLGALGWSSIRYDDPENLPDREVERRRKISESNRGKKPWNVGRKHSEETKLKIKEATRLAMNRPEVQAKLRRPHSLHTEETKGKIKLSLRKYHGPVRQAAPMMLQKVVQRLLVPDSTTDVDAESRFFSRVWTSTELDEAAAPVSEADEAASSLAASATEATDSANDKARGTAVGGAQHDMAGAASPKPAKKSRWTAEHRKNLSEAIKAKWREPEYRQKIMAHMRDPSCQNKRVETRQGSERIYMNWRKTELRLAAVAAEKLDQARGMVANTEAAIAAMEQQVAALAHDPVALEEAQSVVAGAQLMLGSARQQLEALERVTKPMEEVAAEISARPTTAAVREAMAAHKNSQAGHVFMKQRFSTGSSGSRAAATPRTSKSKAAPFSKEEAVAKGLELPDSDAQSLATADVDSSSSTGAPTAAPSERARLGRPQKPAIEGRPSKLDALKQQVGHKQEQRKNGRVWHNGRLVPANEVSSAAPVAPEVQVHG